MRSVPRAKLALHHPIRNLAPFPRSAVVSLFQLPGRGGGRVQGSNGLSFPIQTYDLCNSINYYDST